MPPGLSSFFPHHGPMLTPPPLMQPHARDELFYSWKMSSSGPHFCIRLMEMSSKQWKGSSLGPDYRGRRAESSLICDRSGPSAAETLHESTVEHSSCVLKAVRLEVALRAPVAEAPSAARALIQTVWLEGTQRPRGGFILINTEEKSRKKCCRQTRGSDWSGVAETKQQITDVFTRSLYLWCLYTYFNYHLLNSHCC